jgi:hypothetical protein
MARHSRLIFCSQVLDGLVTISHERGIACLLFEEPGAEIVTGAKDARVRERGGGEWAAEEEEGDGDGEETGEHHEEMAGSHGGERGKGGVLLMTGQAVATQIPI